MTRRRTRRFCRRDGSWRRCCWSDALFRVLRIFFFQRVVVIVLAILTAVVVFVFVLVLVFSPAFAFIIVVIGRAARI